MTVLKTNGGFRILAKSPKRPPLMVITPDSMPPLQVSSQAKVANLNADLLDGLDAGQLAVPAGAVMFFDGTVCPRGWSAFEAARGRTVVGLRAGGTPAGVGGSALPDLGVVTAAEGGGHSHVWSIFEWGTKAWKTWQPGGDLELLMDWGDGMDNAGSGYYPLAPPAGGSGTSLYSTAAVVGHTHTVDMPYVQLLACVKN
jgi:hypothetical protein